MLIADIIPGLPPGREPIGNLALLIRRHFQLTLVPIQRAAVRLLLGAALALSAFAQESGERTARAIRVAQPPVVDGLVNEDIWRLAEPAGDFTQRNPDEGDPSTEKTEVRFAFDDRNLYIGIICFDSNPRGSC